MELVLKSDWLYVMDNVLTPEECKKVIEIGEKYMEKSTTMGEYKEGYRTSSNAYVSNRYDDPIIQKINLVTEVLTELPQDNQEELCIVRYDQGQEYKVHHDFLDTTFDIYFHFSVFLRMSYQTEHLSLAVRLDLSRGLRCLCPSA